MVTILALSLTCFEDDMGYVLFASFKVRFQIEMKGQIEI